MTLPWESCLPVSGSVSFQKILCSHYSLGIVCLILLSSAGNTQLIFFKLPPQTALPHLWRGGIVPRTWFLCKTVICPHLDQPHHLLCSDPASRQRLYRENSCLLAASGEEEMKHWHKEWLLFLFLNCQCGRGQVHWIFAAEQWSNMTDKKGPAITHFPRSGCSPAAVCLWIYLKLPSNSDFLCVVCSLPRTKPENFPFCQPFLWL